MRISVIQMSPGSVKVENISQARRLIEDCVIADRPDMVVLPEIWTCLGGDQATKFAAAERIAIPGSDQPDDDAVAFMRETAQSHGILLHGGSIGEKTEDRLLNTSLLFGPDGAILARYSKIHLFDITTPGGIGYRESDTYRPGQEVVTVAVGGRFGGLRIGMAICYDLRFAELFYRLRLEGADLIVLPAAFTAETGEAHWEPLIRARAIETQCWFAAAATVGAHFDAGNQRRLTHGQSMIVDPWGAVTARASSGPGWATGRYDAEQSARIRAGIPVMDHRRLM